jgi:hypothetical protein
MISTKITKHRFLTDDDILAICGIKSIAWPQHSLESQKEWLISNIHPNDVHFMLFNDGTLIGYTSLVNVDVTIDLDILGVYGIGNVCSAQKGKGYGGLLLNKINHYLVESNTIGLLFCKNNLVDFYAKYNWKLIHNPLIDNFPIPTLSFNMMSNNINFSFNTVRYTDRIF